MDLPDLRFQLQRLSKEANCLLRRSLIASDQAHLVINFCILRITCQRFLERIHGGVKLFIGIVAESEHSVCLGILEIHAQSSSGFSNRIVTVISLIQDQCQPIVDWSKIRVRVFRRAVFVERAIPVALLLLDVSKSEVEGAIERIIANQATDEVIGIFILLMMNERGGLRQWRGTRGVGTVSGLKPMPARGSRPPSSAATVLRQ